MEALRKWNVTFTKHLKQKRKVYRDGFLSLLSSTTKVFLSDTSWKLLDSSVLNKAEEVSTGEMTEFPGHLVEVGNHEANRESLRNLNACGNSFSSLHKLNVQRQQHNITTVKSDVKGALQLM